MVGKRSTMHEAFLPGPALEFHNSEEDLNDCLLVREEFRAQREVL